ncbi:hypothetical protein Cflav_PD2068 [Pedosphaera parvula Ellin514]|uniref:Uncharacterized protein n=1 Tax=Pedosphaera parvula (strain Ellin514) TaxID=320771 RepID=B9XMH7_PEDPL|nr:hypothetical protein Cflav_PD2068 [Pedosphaera parvula Ellin514]
MNRDSGRLLSPQPIKGKHYADNDENNTKDHMAALELKIRHNKPENGQCYNDSKPHIFILC